MIINRDLQRDNVERMRDFEALSSRWDVFIKALPSLLRDLCRREGESVKTNGGG